MAAPQDIQLLAPSFYSSTKSTRAVAGAVAKKGRSSAMEARKQMMDEDDTSVYSIASSSRIEPSPSPAASSRVSARLGSASPSVSPDKFKLHFAGRVYRPLAYASPKEARAMYTKKGNWLGQPDELVEDKDAVIDCVCGDKSDESLMIQCDDCNAWQHCACIGIFKESDCPEFYTCKGCKQDKEKSKGSSRRDAKVLDAPTTVRRTLDERTTGWERERTPPPSKPSKRNARLQDTPESLPSATPERQGTPDSEQSDDNDGLEVLPSSPLAALQSSPSTRRTPTRLPISGLSGSRTSTPSSYGVSKDLLMQMSADQTGKTSPSVIRPTASHPLLTPSKSGATSLKRKRDDEDMENTALDPETVPLPDHYASLLTLHNSVERALLLHLATEGSRAASVTAISSASGSDSDLATSGHNDGDLMVDLPNLVSYSTIRSTVERGSGKKFSVNELGQLVWLWEGGLDGPNALEHEDEDSISENQTKKRRGGLSISVSSVRELDKRNMGKKVYNWSIGINLVIKQNKQLPAFEILDDSPMQKKAKGNNSTSNNSPGGSPQALKRTGMSVLPLWSSKSEDRKLEMRMRLGRCVIKAHENFMSHPVKNDADLLAKKSALLEGFPASAGLPTPPRSTHKHSSHKRSSSHSHSGVFTKGFILDALPPIPSATLPALKPAGDSPVKLTRSTVVSSVAYIDAEVARMDIDKQTDALRLTSTPSSAQTTESKRQALETGEKPGPPGPKVPAKQRALSLLERIKAKEQESLATSPPKSKASFGSLAIHSSNQSKTLARNAARQSLEMASARAKHRESRKLL